MASVLLRLLGPSFLAATLLAPAASAEEPAKLVVAGDPSKPVDPAAPNAWQTAPAERRGGFTIGAAFGFGVASITGFPSDVKKIGYERYYTVTGVRPAPNVEAWIGGALADWVSFGVGLTGTPILATGDNTARSVAGVFHIELFPLYYVSDKLRDFGLMIDAGAGTASIVSKDEKKLVDSSAASLVGLGVHWEPVKFWRFRGGPFLMGNYMWSDSARRGGIFAGWRMSLYAKP